MNRLSMILSWLAIAALTSCAVNAPTEPAGQLGKRYKSTVPGTWTGTLKNGSLSVQMIKNYHPDGTASGVLLIKKSQIGVSLVMPEIRFKSRWRVVGDIVETYHVRASAPGMFKPSEVIRDQLISVEANRIVARAVNDGQIQVLERLGTNGR
jgi:hypothetical protein